LNLRIDDVQCTISILFDRLLFISVRVLERAGTWLGGQYEWRDGLDDRCKQGSHPIHAVQRGLSGRFDALRHGCKRNDRIGLAGRIKKNDEADVLKCHGERGKSDFLGRCIGNRKETRVR